MRIALELAARGLGNTSPNPSVGCVIVKDNKIIARGWTAEGGRPHAETIALKRAGNAANGATAYVTLEPCCHQGKTPPCTEALINAGISRVVIATDDPHKDVAGGGVTALKKAGIKITEGVCKKEAEKLNAGFLKTVLEKKPLITLKLATTSDGKITMPEGKNHWFTSEEARDFAHLLRYRNDAIMVGIETILADNPALTCRLPGLEKHSPLRIIMDSKNRTPDNARVHPCLIIKDKNLDNVLKDLAEKGVTRLLVEGGGKLAESFLENKLVDCFIWIENKKIKGDSKAPNIAKMLKKYIGDMTLVSSEIRGGDKISIYQAKR